MKEQYTGLQGLYFWKILETISKIYDLKDKKVLDFGCGLGKLKRFVPQAVGYDIDSKLTQVLDWKNVDFDVVIANEVFYEMREDEVKNFLQEVYQINPNAKMIVGIGRKGWLNNLGAKILNKEAHDNYKIPPERELEILQEEMDILKRKSVWGLCDVYLFEFKRSN